VEQSRKSWNIIRIERTILKKQDWLLMGRSGNMRAMRAKFKITYIERKYVLTETIYFTAVSKSEGYPEDGSDEDNTFARWTPSAELRMIITNPDLIDKYLPGDQFYVDFTPIF
jgi:hypothetical protein